MYVASTLWITETVFLMSLSRALEIPCLTKSILWDAGEKQPWNTVSVKSVMSKPRQRDILWITELAKIRENTAVIFGISIIIDKYFRFCCICLYAHPLSFQSWIKRQSQCFYLSMLPIVGIPINRHYRFTTHRYANSQDV